MSDLFDVGTEEFDYRSDQGAPLRARLYRPRGRGPFPAMIDLHGGAWILGSFENNDSINRRIAAGGVAVMAADYRLPPAGTYPASVADVNYAVRWLKKNAERCGTRAETVGVMGTSAGGHLAVLAALKPRDPRYAVLPLAGGDDIGAGVSCVVAMWPVICPWSRHRENVERAASGDRAYADRVGSSLDQMSYWETEDAMRDGSPVFAIERGDDIVKPEILYVQASGDRLHPRHSMERFCAVYRQAGGSVEELVVDGEPYDFVRAQPDAAEAKRAVRRMIEFIHEHDAPA